MAAAAAARGETDILFGDVRVVEILSDVRCSHDPRKRSWNAGRHVGPGCSASGTSRTTRKVNVRRDTVQCAAPTYEYHARGTGTERSERGAELATAATGDDGDRGGEREGEKTTNKKPHTHKQLIGPRRVLVRRCECG